MVRKKKTAVAKRKIKLINRLCPGDCLVMTAALECLHRQYKGEYLTDVDTICNAIFQHNPHVSRLEDADSIQMEYPLINSCNQQAVHFIQGYVEFLGRELKIPLKCTVNRPYLYLSPQEKLWINQVEQHCDHKGPFWLVCSGIKGDYTVKGWGVSNYQKVIDNFKGKIQFVQVGEAGHNHIPLKGVINLIGKTDPRQFIRLCYHAKGGLGGVSYMHHIFAAFQKPFVCIASGLEPISWERYQTEIFLCKGNLLPCGHKGGCWKSKILHPPNPTSCTLPVICNNEILPKCMVMIEPEEVISAINNYLDSGLISSI